MRVFVDADSLPVREREILLRRFSKDDVEAYFVADRTLKDVERAIEAHTGRLREGKRDLDRKELKKIRSTIHMVVVEKGDNSADDEIVRIAPSGSIAITHDVPLAKRLVDNGVVVLDDRGGVYTGENINERLSVRNFMTELRAQGIKEEKTKRLTEKDIMEFANSFDKIYTKMEKATSCGK